MTNMEAFTVKNVTVLSLSKKKKIRFINLGSVNFLFKHATCFVIVSSFDFPTSKTFVLSESEFIVCRQ